MKVGEIEWELLKNSPGAATGVVKEVFAGFYALSSAMRWHVISFCAGVRLLALAAQHKVRPFPVTSSPLIRGVGIYFATVPATNMLIGRTGQRYHADSIKIYKVVNGNNQLIGSVNADSLGQSVQFYLYYNQVNTEDAIRKPLDD